MLVPKLPFQSLEHKLGSAKERCKKEIHPMADDKGDDDKIVFTDEQVAELKQAFHCSIRTAAERYQLTSWDGTRNFGRYGKSLSKLLQKLIKTVVGL